MSKTIKISDLDAQMKQMQAMADELDEAIQLIIKSIDSMRNAGLDTVSPLATAKLRELLTVAKTQKENLEVGVRVLQESMNSMQSVDASLRKAIESGNVTSDIEKIKPTYAGTKPSDQVPEVGISNEILNAQNNTELKEGATDPYGFMEGSPSVFMGIPVPDGRECFKAAHLLQIAIYGKTFGQIETSAAYGGFIPADHLRVGDVVQFGSGDYIYKENRVTEHWVVVTGISTDGKITVADGNGPSTWDLDAYCSGAADYTPGKIHYGNVIDCKNIAITQIRHLQ